ncbi:MAG: ABC transporter permease [Anaerolineae bacterium]|jgi:putative ABC transport system permease protein
MKLFSTLFSIVILAAKRLWNHRLLMLCLLVGLVSAVGVLSSIPLYADAAHHQLLQGELTDAGTYRPPYAFMWRYVGAWHGEITWEDYTPADEYLTQQAAAVIGLPQTALVRHVQTANLRLFAASDEEGFDPDEALLWTNLGFVTGLPEHIELLEGDLPHFQEGDETVPVLVSQELAEQLGLQVGERYTLFGGAQGEQLAVQISGVWRPLNPFDPFWFYLPSAFDEVLLTTEPSYVAQVTPALEKPVALAVWYQLFDGDQVRTSNVPRLLNRIARVESRFAALLNHATLDVSPVDALQEYREEARTLTVMLGLFSIPTVILVLYFIGLIAGMVVRRSQGEIATLRSRGTTRLQIVGIYLLEGLLVGGVGLAGGLLLGRRLAELMGQTRTFLEMDLTMAPLPITFSETALRYGLAGVGLALLALLAPALGASRHTIVTFKWERARALIRPLWQRYFLDLLLLALPLYGWYTLRRQGTVTLIGQGDDPFSNPLLFLVPALFCFALALLFVRVFPWLMGVLAWLAARLPGATLVLTLRQLARASSLYTGPLLLLSLTLSLATFTASMAVTLDSHLSDQIYYQTGADLNLSEIGESTEPPEQEGGLFGQPQEQQQEEEESTEPRWLFLPVAEHLEVPGVLAAARVGDYNASANIGGQSQRGRLLGVDRIDFARVSFFRSDFAAGEPLGGLMNRLAMDPAGVLVSRDFLGQHSLTVGDPLRLTVSIEGEVHEIAFTIVGSLRLFPTLYPQDGPFFVASLNTIHEGMEDVYPYEVWLSTAPDVHYQEIVDGARQEGFIIVTAFDARSTILEEQTRPERQGLFGLLSVGFLAGAVLTVLGFLVYAIVSFQRRFIELGMLRAVGLSVWQMAGYLTGEQALLILTGAGLGSGLGMWASNLFVPYFQIGSDKLSRVPPFVVRIAWSELRTIYAVFGIMFVVAVSVLVGLLARMRVFEAVKLGETE